MSIWSRLRSFFSNDKGSLVRDGHELRWDRQRLPIAVLIGQFVPGAHASAVEQAVRHINAATDLRIFQFPVPATGSSISAFRDPAMHSRIRNSVLVEMADLGDPHGHTEHRYDPKTGEIGNAWVTLPKQGLAYAALFAVVLHEMGHVLGLDHDSTPDSIMWPSVRAQGQLLLSGDVKRLKQAYGGT